MRKKETMSFCCHQLNVGVSKIKCFPAVIEIVNKQLPDRVRPDKTVSFYIYQVDLAFKLHQLVKNNHSGI
jgi:hypothetical protein